MLNETKTSGTHVSIRARLAVAILLTGLITLASPFEQKLPAAQAFSHHQKTSGALPDGAPLPDVEIDPLDRITPYEALVAARKSLKTRDETKATEFFERGIAALRKRKRYNKPLAKALVSEYSMLMRDHLNTDRAVQLEKEFHVKNKRKRTNSKTSKKES